jgi:hypothetical protein
MQHEEVPNREMLLRHRAIPQQVQKRVWFVLGEDAMTFTIHASKNGQSVVTVRISPAVAVDKARVLESLGWQVHVTDSAGHRFTPSEFDWLSSLAGETA